MTLQDFYSDLYKRIRLNHQRLSSETYAGEHVFREAEYNWEGDWEGRALLAFVCQYRMTGEKIPALEYEMEHLAEKTNSCGYFGRIADGIVQSEQQFSGHSWLLRGLCEYYKTFGGAKVLNVIHSIMQNLYLPCIGLCSSYPDTPRPREGEVMGYLLGAEKGWLLSSDVGCAFMAIDGVTAVCKICPRPEYLGLARTLIETFVKLDHYALSAQTHATLSATRGIIRMYEITGEEYYLKKAIELYRLYCEKGRGLTYENINWFGRNDTFTEPCAVIDSMIVALKLYDKTGKPEYLTDARRIYYNGINLGQRDNGGAGTNLAVTSNSAVWAMNTYEAYFCCTMRLAEGLLYARRYADFIYIDNDAFPVEKDEFGRYFKGDRLMCLIEGEKTLKPLPEIYKYPKSELEKLKIKVVFDKDERF